MVHKTDELNSKGTTMGPLAGKDTDYKWNRSAVPLDRSHIFNTWSYLAYRCTVISLPTRGSSSLFRWWTVSRWPLMKEARESL